LICCAAESRQLKNSNFITPEVIWSKKNFEIDAQGQKYKNGYLAKNSHFAILALLPLYKKCMKDLLHNFAQKVSQALSRPVHGLI